MILGLSIDTMHYLLSCTPTKTIEIDQDLILEVSEEGLNTNYLIELHDTG